MPLCPVLIENRNDLSVATEEFKRRSKELDRWIRVIQEQKAVITEMEQHVRTLQRSVGTIEQEYEETKEAIRSIEKRIGECTMAVLAQQ
jgi:septal ring factor EnvC (AmiA/AmiB activator)